MYKKFELVGNIEEATAITHNGVFHADEVFATALLSMIMEVKLFRTRALSAQDKASDIIMYDVGGVYDIKEVLKKSEMMGLSIQVLAYCGIDTEKMSYWKITVRVHILRLVLAI